MIEDGGSTSYLYDLLRARKDGVESTGNGRRESFRHLPLPRMTNTFFAPGDASPRTTDRRRRARALRGLVRRRPGGAGHRRLRLRRLRGLPDRERQGHGAGARRDPDRQRARGARAIDGIAADLESRPASAGRAATVPAGVGQPHVRHHARSPSGGTRREARRRRPRPRGRGRAGGRRDRRRGVGRGVHEPRVRVYAGEVESLSDAGAAGSGVRAFAGHRAGYAYGTDLSDDGRGGGGRRPRARPPRWPTRTSTTACPTRRALRRDGLASRTSAAGPPSGTSSSRSGSTGPRARARGHAGRELRLRRRPRARSRSPTRAASRPRTGHAGVGLRVRVRRRGRRPDDRPRRGHGRATPASSTRRRSAPRRPSARSRSSARASRRAAAARWSSTRSSRRVHRLHRRDAVRRRRAARPLAVRGPRGRGGGGSALCGSPTTAPSRTGPSSAPFDGEGTPTRRTPLIEDGRCSASSTTRARRGRRAARPPATRAAARTARRRRSGPRT